MKNLFLFLFLALSCFGQLPEPKSNQIRITITSDDGGYISGNANKKEYLRVKSYLLKWEPIFKLTDWKIDIAPVPDYILNDLHPEGVLLGVSTWDVESQTGTIYVLDQKHLKLYKKLYGKKHTFLSIEKEQEIIVVHEILHNLINHGDEEWAVQVLSNLIINHKLPPELLEDREDDSE